MKKVLSIIVLLMIVITSFFMINSAKVSADHKVITADDAFGGSWVQYVLPNGGNQDSGWNNPEFKVDGVRLTHNSLTDEKGKKYEITTGTQLPVYGSIAGYRSHTIEGHFVKDTTNGKEDYYTSRGCINDASYCAESGHGMHSGTPGNNSFMRYQLDSPTKNFSPVNTCGSQNCVFAHIKYANDRQYLKITTYPTNNRELKQEVVSTVSDEGEILTFVKVTNTSSKNIPHIRIGAQITLGSKENYRLSATGFNGLNIKALDENNNRNLPKYFKAISGARIYADQWDINNIDKLTVADNSPMCKDLGTVVNSGKARAVYFVAEQSSIPSYGEINFSYLTSFRPEKTPDNVVHKTYVNQEVGEVFTKEDERGATCSKYNIDIKEIKGYEFVNTTGDPASGTFDGKEKNVTYYYKRKNLKAIGKHIDEQGNSISSDSTAAGLYGDKVSLSSKDIYGYRYLRWTKGGSYGTSKTMELTLADSTYSGAKGDENTVFFNYQKKKEFNLKINHYSRDNKNIFHSENIPVFADDNYNLNDYIRTLTGHEFVEADHPMQFTMGYANLEVTLEYVKIKTNIIVEYLDDSNKKIIPDIVYNGKYESWQNIEEKKFDGYFLDTNYVKPEIQQQFGLKDKTITYHYDREKIKFKVIHKDESGDILSEKEVEYKYLDEYDESALLDNDDYIYVSDSGNTKGTVSLKQKDVVIIYHQKVKVKIDVNYYDENNKVMDKEVINGREGDSYSIKTKTFKGYEIVKIDGALNGVYSNKDLVVNIYYDIIKSKVIVNYFLENTSQSLAESTIINGKYGEEYQTKPKEITGYKVVQSPSNANGVFGSNNINVNYYYRALRTSTVTINYYNELGEKLIDSIVMSGLEGTAYTSEQKEFEGHTFIKVSGDSPSGVYTVANKTVNYQYKRNEYKVITKYVDENMQEITNNKIITKKYGDAYQTNPEEFSDYILKTIPDNASGKIGASDIEVIYEYRLKKDFEINVEYVDDRNRLLGSAILKGKENDEYESKQLEFDGYIFVKVEGQPSGIFSENNSKIVYHYDRQISKVIIKYLGYENNDLSDEGTEIKADTIIEGKYRDDYQVDIPNIENYEYRSSDKDLSGEYQLDSVVIKLAYYHKDSEVLVEYVDDRNVQIKKIILNGKQGKEYTSEQLEFEGHDFNYLQGDATGIFKGEKQHIIYFYDRHLSKVIVKHYGYDSLIMRMDPIIIADDYSLVDKYQNFYKIEPQEIEGYEFVEADQPLENMYFLGDKVINLKYYHKDAQVKVKYVDDLGNLLDERILNGKYGNEYHSEKLEFEGYLFKTVSENASGLYSDDNDDIVYQYERVASKIIVNYLGYEKKDFSDKATTIHKDSVYNGKYLDNYKIVPLYFTDYEFKEADQRLEGKYGLQTLVVNLKYYHKDAHIKVNYFDDNNKILEKKNLQGKYGEDYKSNKLDFKGYNFVRVNGDVKGKFSKDNDEINYYYERLTTTLTIKYIDYKSKEELLKSRVIKAKYQDEVIVEIPEIKGYEALSKNNVKVSFGVDDQVLILEYKKDTNINETKELPNTGTYSLMISGLLSIVFTIGLALRIKCSY